MLAKLNRRINHAFYIEVPNEILIERISNRLVCPTCKRSYNLKTRPPKVAGICDYDGTKLVQRPDDEPEKVAIRLRAYEEQTAPLVDYYRQKETIIHVNGQSTNPEDVYAKINEYLMS
jgi:adenylate kinase